MMQILRNVNKRQRGFTAIEFVVGIAIIGLIGAAVTTGIMQVFKGSTLSNDRMTAINNVRNAGDWIIRDAQMAENTITITANCPSVIIWHDYSPSVKYQVDYTMSGTNLMRSYRVNDGAPAVVTVAQYITTITSTFSGNKLSVTLTATVGSVSETRTFVISLRDIPQ